MILHGKSLENGPSKLEVGEIAANNCLLEPFVCHPETMTLSITEQDRRPAQGSIMDFSLPNDGFQKQTVLVIATLIGDFDAFQALLEKAKLSKLS